jgi:asparagine synthase (glutamine-hydrolysing)
MEVKEVSALISSVVAIAGSNERIARTLFQCLSCAMESRGQTGAYKASGNVVLGVAFADNGISISFDGHLFGQYSNAKAVIDGYRKEGTSFFSKLDGFFAFCLWDEENDILVAARDPLGVRPLYYMRLGRTIILVSQISAFFALNKTLKPNENLICEYLLTGNHPRNGQTFYDEIKEVLPGQYLAISDNNITAQKSYSASSKKIIANQRNRNSVEEFSVLFTKTVQRMVPQEGKYATSLSGGLDSTLLASTIQKFESDNNHRLYSVVCKDASYKDWELPYIEDFKRHIDKDVNYLEVPFPPSWRDLEDYVNQISEPAPLLIYYISYVISKKIANGKINVVFTGTGGDDFMLGLEWQHTDYLRELWLRKDFCRFIREVFGYLLNQAYLLNAHDVKSIGNFAKIRFRGSEKNLDFLSTEFVRRNYRKPSRSDYDSIGDIIEYAEYLDRIYASKGIEPLHPFLDKELVNYMRNLPSDAKIRWGTRKYLLRQIAKGLVPESIRKCKRKFASSIPLSGWLIAWKDYIEEILDSAEFSKRGYYNVENIRHAYKKMLDRQFDPIQEFRIATQLWRVINLELWLRKSLAIRSFLG